MRVVVVGQGYVGLPLAIRAAEVGHEVIGYDVDPRRVKSLAAGESFVEDVSSERLREAMDRGAYRPSESARDCGGFDVAVVTVPTPLHEGTPDLRYAPERRSSWSRPRIPAPPRSCSRRSWRTARD
jgi:UDP-N-acetyl-D-glucosamine dehydrogenase